MGTENTVLIITITFRDMPHINKRLKTNKLDGTLKIQY